MRKNILSLSIAAMIGSLGVAHAAVIVPGTQAVVGGATITGGLIPASGVAAASSLVLAAGGVGHALITPYFTAQAGNATVISIVNTDTANGKAVKVRFRGQANSDDVLDFAVYMSPNDHWSAVVTKNATTGLAQLTTNDNTCTVPPLVKGVAQSFITARLPSYATATDLANHTSEGYIEIFNMADIPVTTSTSGLYQSILHSQSTSTPLNCGAAAVQVAPLADAVSEADAISKGFVAPTTGLFGNWTIINVPATTTFSGSMTAIRAMVGGVDGYGNYVLSPQSGSAASNVAAQTADPLFRSSTTTISNTGTPGATASSAATAAFFDLPDMSTPYTPAGLAAGLLTSPGSASPFTGNDLLPLGQAFNVTSALAITTLSNEYSTDPTLTATTDWNFSMPTRRYSVNYKYGTSAATGTRIFSPVAAANGGVGTQFFHAAGSGVGNVTVSGDRLCVTATSQAFYDREEGNRVSGAVFSPGSVATFTFCGETSVTTFGSGASVLGASNGSSTTSAFVNGWGRVNIGGIGLPILGNSFIKLNNPQVSAGVSGTYGISSVHRFSK